MTTLRGCWWNVWQDARKDANGAPAIARRVAQLVTTYDLDWICLQEVYQYQQYGAKGDLLQLIQSATGWEYVFVPSTTYHYPISYRSKSTAFDDNYVEGIAIFTKLPIVRRRSTPLSSHPHRSGTITTKHLLELDLKISENKSITVGNTHWTFMTNKNRLYRRAQMQAFCEHMQTINPKTPYVVGGDFNTLATHPTIHTLRKLFNLRTGTPLHPTWLFNGKNRNILRSNIDYVGVPLFNPLRFKEFTVLMDRSPSDHAPLLGTFELDS